MVVPFLFQEVPHGKENLIRRQRRMILPGVSPAAFLLTSLRMCYNWCLHADAHVRALCVVEQDDTFQFRLAVLSCGYCHLVKPFSLEYAVSPCHFSNGGHQKIGYILFQFLSPFWAKVFPSYVHIITKVMETINYSPKKDSKDTWASIT